jgi:hypothetical protein
MCSVLATAGIAAMLAGCGGEEPATSPPGTPDNPLKAQQTKSREPGGAQAATKPGYQKLIERQSSKPGTSFSPCSLVTRAQARAFVGAPIQLPFEAPQGPTCIYRAADGKSVVTLAVQDAEFRELAGRVQQATRVKLFGRTGTCGQYGQPTLYLSLAGGRVLTVGSAPCDIAKRFASKAAQRLGA